MKHIILSSLLFTPIAFAGTEETEHHSAKHFDHNRVDSHAPIGVMADHTHHTGEWMLSYRFMTMAMESNRNGTNSISDASVLTNFVATPTDMQMDMHMFGAMYAPTDRLTLMGMFNLVESSMNHLTRTGMRFQTQSSGLGDASLGALYRFYDGDRSRSHFGLSVLLPTAEVKETDGTPVGPNSRLPYPMQLGSGSWGLAPSLTFLKQEDQWAWGAQANAKFYLDDNSQDYRLGDRGELTAWASRLINEDWSTSLRLSVQKWDNIEGADSAITTTPPGGPLAGVPLIPTAFNNLRAGERLELGWGLNGKLGKSGARLGIELSTPIWQDLEGPQLATDWTATIGLQYSF